MKKAISILLSLALAVGLLTGCSAASTPDSGSKKLRIVTTISQSTTGFGKSWGIRLTTWS